MDPSTRIIIIDDNLHWLTALTELLERRGLAVLAVDDPQQALALLQRYDVPLMICDLEMPGMDGLEVLRRVRETRRPVEVLMLSSADAPEVRRQALAQGARAFLPKTVTPLEILRQVQQLLEGALAASRPALWQRLLPAPVVRGRNARARLRQCPGDGPCE